MYPSIDEEYDLLAALCFDQSNGTEDPYVYIQTDQEYMFSDFGSSGVNLQQEQGQVGSIEAQFDSFTGNLPQLHNVGGENNVRVFYSSSIVLGQLDIAASFSGVLQQETNQVCSFRGRNEDLGPHVQQELERVCSSVVEINYSSSVGNVKEEQEHVEGESSRKRSRTGPCSKPGTRTCREKMRREKLNDRFMDLSSILEPGRTPKTVKLAIIDDAIRVVIQLRGEADELKETNQKLQVEIKSIKAENNELKEEKLVLKSYKEKMEQRLQSMAVQPHQPVFHPNKMVAHPSYGYHPSMQMWPFLNPVDRDTAHDHQHTSYAA